MRSLLAAAVAVLLGLLDVVRLPLHLPSLWLLLAVVTVLATPEGTGCLGLPGVSPIERNGP